MIYFILYLVIGLIPATITIMKDREDLFVKDLPKIFFVIAVWPCLIYLVANEFKLTSKFLNLRIFKFKK